MTQPITSFSGEFRFLSNFWPAEVEFDKHEFPTNEHAYQYAKCVDPAWKEFFKTTKMTAGQAKRMGRKLSDGDLAPFNLNWVQEKRWFEYNRHVMLELNLKKFTRHLDLRQKLIDTGDAELVEGNTWGDTYWGQCPVGNGENHLGKCLMLVRDILRKNNVSDKN